MPYNTDNKTADVTDIATNEHLYRPTPSHVPLKTTNYSRKFGFTQQRHVITPPVKRS